MAANNLSNVFHKLNTLQKTFNSNVIATYAIEKVHKDYMNRVFVLNINKYGANLPQYSDNDIAYDPDLHNKPGDSTYRLRTKKGKNRYVMHGFKELRATYGLSTSNVTLRYSGNLFRSIITHADKGGKAVFGFNNIEELYKSYAVAERIYATDIFFSKKGNRILNQDVITINSSNAYNNIFGLSQQEKDLARSSVIEAVNKAIRDAGFGSS